MRSVLVLVGVIVMAGCGNAGLQKSGSKDVQPVQTKASAWEAGTESADAETPALLWNGLIGVRLGRDSGGSGLPFFAIDEYDSQGEEKIRTLPNPMDLEWSVAGSKLAPESGRDYSQSIDFRTGVLATKWKQSVKGGEVAVESRIVIHPGQRQIAQEWRILAPPGSLAQLKMAGFAESGLKTTTQGSEESLVEFEFGPSRTPASLRLKMFGGWEGSWKFAGRTIAWDGQMLGSEWLKLERTFSLASSPNQVTMREARGIKRHAPLTPAPNPLGYSDVERASTEALADRWKTDIEIDGPIEDQQAIRSFLYYLRSSIHPEGGMSVSPMGLSSATYFGHVFWDADIWVFPALMFVDPERAAAIPDYRRHREPEAIEDFKKWVADGRPTGKEPLGPLHQGIDFPPGAKFPWESSVSGKETVPGPSRFQDHITGSVHWAIDQASSLGFVDEESRSQALKRARVFFAVRTQVDPEKGTVLRGTMSPDENHIGDNDLYTNVLADWILFHESPANERGGLVLPEDSTSLLTYDNDALRSYKQAAAVLAIYPLQHPKAEAQAKVMMERFASKVTPNGPAMSDSVHALIWARLGEQEKAYETWRKSWKDFTNHPLMLFSEKRKKEVTYFTTGAGGCLQTVIYGFLGFRVDSKPQPGAAWSLPLNNGKVLSIKPNLPEEWKRAVFRNFKVLGKTYTLTVEGDKATVVENG